MTNRRTVLLTTAGVVVVGLIAFLATWLSSTDATRPASSPTPTAATLAPAISGPASSATPGESHDDHAEDPDVDNELTWKPVVTNFGRNFINTSGGNKAWRKRLIGNPARPYVTTAVAKQLATVDVDNVPAGHYNSYAIVKTSSLEVAVQVDYTEGWSMILYLNTDGTNWQVYAYDKYEE